MTSHDVSPAWASFSRVYWTIAATLAVLLLLFWAMGFGPGGRACTIPGASATGTSVAAAPKAAATPAAPAPTAVTAPPTAQPSAPASAPATATPTAPITAAAAPSAALPPAAKLYFPVARITLPQNTVPALAPIAAYLMLNPQAKASISGFHDASGNRARNEALALDRARAARGALERAGIERERIVLQKPAQTTGSGDAREARRVEVAVVQP
jgi:K(+)-stimulated pyrophosphate-energized sodium pump